MQRDPVAGEWGSLPGFAAVLGAAGLLPFLGCGLGAVSLDDSRAPQMLAALMAYGAVVLSFLGAVHWGWALQPAPGAAPRVIRSRLLLGIVPSLVGWAASLLAVAVSAEVGLGVLIAGFIATAVVEQQGRHRGLVPSGYMWLRWVLTVVVVAVLVTVLVLRLVGAKIIL